MHVGRTIRLLRTSAKMKQQDLAARLEVSVNYLSLIENEHREPSMGLLKRFSQEFDIPASYLMLGEQTSSGPSEEKLLNQINRLMLELFSHRIQAKRKS